MAKSQPTDPRDAERERALQELRAELGFDELTYESCVRELLDELIGPPPPADGGARREPTRVVQAGPPRRD
jgi:hypothetical protein